MSYGYLDTPGCVNTCQYIGKNQWRQEPIEDFPMVDYAWNDKWKSRNKLFPVSVFFVRIFFWKNNSEIPTHSATKPQTTTQTSIPSSRRSSLPSNSEHHCGKRVRFLVLTMAEDYFRKTFRSQPLEETTITLPLPAYETRAHGAGIADDVLLCDPTLSWDGKFAGTHSFFIVGNPI